MEHDGDEELVEELSDLPARRMTPFDLAISVVAFFGVVVEDLYQWIEHITRLMVMHRNYTEEQESFAEAVRSDIESIPSTEE